MSRYAADVFDPFEDEGFDLPLSLDHLFAEDDLEDLDDLDVAGLDDLDLDRELDLDPDVDDDGHTLH